MLPSAQPLAKAPGRPALAEPRRCTAGTCLTASEYDSLIQLSRASGCSISDLIRELISEAILARLRRI